MSAMTNHPVSSPVMGRSRDIKRRLEVIQKKMADLQELGVPCAFCYTSVRNSGSLFTIGNKAITQIMEHSRDTILNSLQQQMVSSALDHHTVTDQQSIAPEKPHTTTINTTELHQPLDRQKEMEIVLPRLPQPLSDISLHDLHVLIIGIVKDLGIKWSDARPSFWPATIPFQHPQTAPEGFKGSAWTNALRDVLRSIYSYCGYNIDTYRKYNISQAVIEQSHDTCSRSHDTQNGNHQCSSVESDDVDEEDEIDVVNEPSSVDGVSSSLVCSDGRGSTHLSATSSSGSYMTLNYLSTRSHDSHMTDQSDREEEDDRVSVCSDDPNITSTDNYFYYELARGDSLESSPGGHHAPLSTIGTPLGQHDITSDASTTPSPKPHPLISTQSPFLYCTPQLYSQLYPTALHTATAAAATTPFLLQPNLLLKAPNPLLFPISGTSGNPNSTTHTNDDGVVMSPSIKSPSLPTLPYTLSRPSLHIPQSSNPTHSIATTQQPLSSGNVSKNSVAKDTHTSPSIHSLKTTPLPISSSSNTAEVPQLQEGKNKKGRNHGIYIYTTPSEPLKFMSLGNNESTKSTNKATPGTFNKGSDRKSMYSGEKLITMGTTVAPPNRMTRPAAETLLVKDPKSHYQQPQSILSPRAITLAGTRNKDDQMRQKSLTQNVTPPTSADDKANTKKPLSGVKRRRELVFHWYHSPEQTVPSALPPPAKRINNPAGTV